MECRELECAHLGHTAVLNACSAHIVPIYETAITG